MGESAQGSVGNSPGATIWPGRVSLFSALLLLAACADDPAPSGNMVIAAPSPVTIVAAPPVAATPAIPVEPMPSGSPVMRPQKTFVDPPLPPELQDDGGLTPLPPPPGVQNQQ